MPAPKVMMPEGGAAAAWGARPGGIMSGLPHPSPFLNPPHPQWVAYPRTREVLEGGGGPKSVCTKNSPTRFSLL